MLYKDTNFFTRQNAFTLAEVLITIGLIGVVAAMTIASVIDRSRKLQFISSFKKNLSILNQAAQYSEANYDFNFATVSSNCTKPSTEKAPGVQSLCGMFNSALKSTVIKDYTKLKLPNKKLYYKQLFETTPNDTVVKEQHVQLYYVQMIDGSFFAFHAPMVGSRDDVKCTLRGRTLNEALKTPSFQKYCIGIIDVNGIKPPNKEIRCHDGKAHTTDIDAHCIVDNKSEYLTDVFPVAYFDSNVVPASAAARAVLLLK